MCGVVPSLDVYPRLINPVLISDQSYNQQTWPRRILSFTPTTGAPVRAHTTWSGHVLTNPVAHRAHITLAELGLSYKEEIIDLDTPRTPEYLKVNPRGLVPSISYNGEIITESAIVAQFLADTYPSDFLPASSDPKGALTRARINFFTDAWSTKVQSHIFKLTYSASVVSEEVVKDATASIVKEIEPLLSNAAPFFNGSDKLTFAEVSLLIPTCTLANKATGDRRTLCHPLLHPEQARPRPR
jgi:glutathione S-transferase